MLCDLCVLVFKLVLLCFCFLWCKKHDVHPPPPPALPPIVGAIDVPLLVLLCRGGGGAQRGRTESRWLGLDALRFPALLKKKFDRNLK